MRNQQVSEVQVHVVVLFDVCFFLIITFILTALNSDYERFTTDITFTSQVCGIIIRTGMDSIYENFEVFSLNLSVVDTSANPRIVLGENKTIRIREDQSKSWITFTSYPLSLLLQELEYR